MRADDAHQAAEAVDGLNDFGDERRIQPATIRQLADRGLDPRQKAIRVLTVLVVHNGPARGCKSRKPGAIAGPTARLMAGGNRCATGYAARCRACAAAGYCRLA